MKKIPSLLQGLALFALLAANLAVGARLFAQETAATAAADDPEASPYEMYALFSKVVEQIRANYVDADKTGYQDLVEAALEGMLQSLDPHSQFMDKEAFTAMREDTSGHFGGLGITIGLRDGVLTVISPMEQTPAFRAGLLPGDKIVEIEDDPTSGLDLDAAVKRLRGEPGTRVKIKVFRPKTQLVKTMTLERAVINVPSVKDAKMLDGGIAYVRLLQFGQTTAADLQKELDRFKEEGARALVLDLRSNPGGLLTTAVEVAQKFLPRGSLIVFTRGRNGEISSSFKARLRHPFPEVPMVVLVNGASASASEIVAGALQDHKRAVLLGEKTFGKGSVQTVLPLDGGTALRLTTAKYYTPSERVIHENGIEPNVVVPLSMADWRDIIIARNAAEVIDGEDVVPETDADGQRADEGWHPYDEGIDDGESFLPDSAASSAPEPKNRNPRDPQLERACDMLRGMLVFTGR